MRFGLGQSALRVEDKRFLTGQGKYSDDHNLAGQCYGTVVRSPYAHARIISIDINKASSAPGVLAILTGEDVDNTQLGPIPGFEGLAMPDGSAAPVPNHPVLLCDTVRYVGDYVAFVVAETQIQARNAAELVAIEYEVLDSVTKTSAAMGGIQVWDDNPNNIAFVHEKGDAEAVELAFQSAPHLIKLEVPVSRVAMCPMEPRVALGIYDQGQDHYTIISGCQSPHDLQRHLAAILKVGEHQVRYISPDMGGGFGLRSNVFPEQILVLWAAKVVGRPVKWVGDRSEAFLADDQGRDMHLTVELSLDNLHHFTGLRLTKIANLGAYMCVFSPFPAFANLGGLAGPYKTPAIYADVTAVYTHSTPTGPYRGAGRPEASLAIEQAIDQAARKLSVDPLQLRLNNMISPEEMPYQTGLQYCYDTGEFAKNMDQAQHLIDYKCFQQRAQLSSDDGKIRGIGVVYTVEQSAGPSDEGAFIRFSPDGTAIIGTGLHSHGQGHETVFRQVIHDTLGLEFEQVRYVQGDTDQIRMGGGTGGSRSSGVGSGALLRASKLIIEKGRLIAAHLLEVAPADIEFDTGIFNIPGTDRSVTLSAVVAASFNSSQRPSDVDTGLSAFGSFSHRTATYPNGCHICEIEVDSETGVIEIWRYVVVKDVGRVMNPMILEGQLQGGIVQGFSQIVLENVVLDDQGQPLTGSFMDYALPRADEVPFCEVYTNEVLTPTNPFGIKGAGEAGTVGGLSAVSAAVDNALSRAGANKVSMPATPYRVWQALNARGHLAN